MVHIAMKVERQLKRKGGSRFGVATPSGSLSPSKLSRRIDDELDFQSKVEPLKKKKDVPDVGKGKLTSQTSKSSEVKCFNCLGIGHVPLQFPHRCTMILRVDGGFKSDEEVNEESK